MGIKVCCLKLDHGNCDVRAVCCDSFQVRQQIIKRKSLLHLAFSGAESCDMTQFQFIAEDTDQFAEWFYFCRHLKVIRTECIHRKTDTLFYCILQHIQLILCLIRKCNFLLVQLRRNL